MTTAPTDQKWLAKNQRIAAASKATHQRRKTQFYRTYELKITKAKLSPATLAHLECLFLEAKWFYNFLLSQKDLFATETKNLYKLKVIPVKVGEKFEDRELRCLSAQMKQELLAKIHDVIRALAQLKKNCHKVGRLKFKR